ncbi:MAG TPA: hypothetical protein PK431_01490 [Chitinophagales bacterium]|nr:hypothetical protein [Chitinophagales bacterium]
MAKSITQKNLDQALVKAVVEKVVTCMQPDEIDSKLCYTDGGRFCLMLSEDQIKTLREFIKIK